MAGDQFLFPSPLPRGFPCKSLALFSPRCLGIPRPCHRQRARHLARDSEWGAKISEWLDSIDVL
jgi:hypothetical protein